MKHRSIVEKKFTTAGMTKADRNLLMKKFFNEVQKCMKHHADKNGRETFIVIISASKE